MLQLHPMAEYLTCFWIMTLVYAFVTTVWKISIHSGVISALVTFIVLTEGVKWAFLYTIVLAVIWARVVGRYHRLSQAIVGGIVPVVVLPLWFLVFGLV